MSIAHCWFLQKLVAYYFILRMAIIAKITHLVYDNLNVKGVNKCVSTFRQFDIKFWMEDMIIYSWLEFTRININLLVRKIQTFYFIYIYTRVYMKIMEDFSFCVIWLLIFQDILKAKISCQYNFHTKISLWFTILYCATDIWQTLKLTVLRWNLLMSCQV